MKGFYSTVFYKIWKRFLTFFGDIYFATEPPKVKAVHLRKLLNLLKPGQILARKYTYYLDSYFIKGKYSHSGIYIGDGKMIHAVAEGVCEIDVLDFTKDSDGFIILQPPYKTEEDLYKAIKYAEQQIGKPYDFIFNDHDQSSFYCHELSWAALKEGSVIINPKESIVYASDLTDACESIYEAP